MIVESDSLKKDIRDFVLWKGRDKVEEFEPVWSSPWGDGRPGWHIECSAMSTKMFGSNLDIHSGGWDLIFPHHENEEAQCCAYLDSSEWVKHWIHFGHLHFSGDAFKMSKSRGNYLSIEDFLNSYANGPQILRMFTLQSHYKSPLEFSDKAIEHARQLFSKFKFFHEDCTSVLNGHKSFDSPKIDWHVFNHTKQCVDAALNNDFDTAQAIDILIKFVSSANPGFSKLGQKTDFSLVLSMKSFISTIFNVLGLSLDNYQNSSISKTQVDSICTQFSEFRNNVRQAALGQCNRNELLTLCDSARASLVNKWGVNVRDIENRNKVNR